MSEHTCEFSNGPCAACSPDFGAPDTRMSGPCVTCGYTLDDVDADGKERTALRAEVERLRSIAFSGWVSARALAIAHGAAATEREANHVIMDLERGMGAGKRHAPRPVFDHPFDEKMWIEAQNGTL